MRPRKAYMLDDFATGGSAAPAVRFGASIVASTVMYAGIVTAALAASSMAAEAIHENPEVQVAFAPPPIPDVPPPPPPEPPPPPPAPEPAPAAAPQPQPRRQRSPAPARNEPPPPARRGRPRPQVNTPTEIPDERPEESDGELAPADNPFAPEDEGDPNGVEGGVVGGVVGGTGTGPASGTGEPGPTRSGARRGADRGPMRVPESATPASINRAAIVQNFDIPPAVRSAGIARITLVVRLTIDRQGNISRIDVLRGHPLVPNQNIIQAIRQMGRVEPARLADGTPFAAIQVVPIVIAVRL